MGAHTKRTRSDDLRELEVKHARLREAAEGLLKVAMKGTNQEQSRAMTALRAALEEDEK